MGAVGANENQSSGGQKDGSELSSCDHLWAAVPPLVLFLALSYLPPASLLFCFTSTLIS